ncbi:MAG: cytochrome-c peroxidase [Kiloniellaceae bacterium]
MTLFATAKVFLEWGVAGVCRAVARRAWALAVVAPLVAVPVTMQRQLALPAHEAPAPASGAVEEPITPLPPPPSADALVVSLGELLFRDTRLSRDNTLSCASCHDLATNGAGGKSRDIGLDGQVLVLNTPTVFNAALVFRFNWEGQFRSLEDQIVASLENPQIMGTTLEAAAGRLNTDPAMINRFKAAFGQRPDRASIVQALATFQRSLTTPGSRFDRWLRGDSDALTAQELRGYALFKSLGCISCHHGINVGANLFARHGIFHPLASPMPERLRVPGLRNVEATAPYFHDGSAPTLQDAVRRMARSQLNSTLTDEQVEGIVAFLRTLTGEFEGQPVRGPL